MQKKKCKRRPEITNFTWSLDIFKFLGCLGLNISRSPGPWQQAGLVPQPLPLPCQPSPRGPDALIPPCALGIQVFTLSDLKPNPSLFLMICLLFLRIGVALCTPLCRHPDLPASPQVCCLMLLFHVPRGSAWGYLFFHLLLSGSSFSCQLFRPRADSVHSCPDALGVLSWLDWCL